MTHRIDNVVRRFPFGLFDDERAVDRRRLCVVVAFLEWSVVGCQSSAFGSSFAVLSFLFLVLRIGRDRISLDCVTARSSTRASVAEESRPTGFPFF